MKVSSSINYMLTVAQREVFFQFSKRLSEYGITPGQYDVLNCLWENGFTTPKEIAQYLHLENSSVSGVLDRMQRRGLIDRILDPNDRRSIRVIATDAGMAIKEDVLLTISQLNNHFLCEFSAEEKQLLINGLQHIGKITKPYRRN